MSIFLSPPLTNHYLFPATLSSDIVQGLLREQLGFNGLILSDCLEMKAISETFGTERAAVKALRAGIDLVLVSHHYMRQQGCIEAIRVAVQTHELSSQAVQLAAEHMLRLQANYLSWKETATSATLPACIGCEAHLHLKNQAYELSTTLVRNEDALLPLHLDAGERIVVLSPRRNSISMVEDRYYADDVLSDIRGQYNTTGKTLSIASGAAANA